MKDLKLKAILEELDSRLADSIDKLEEITPDLEEDSDAFIADDVRELASELEMEYVQIDNDLYYSQY